MTEQKTKIALITLAFALFSITLIGLVWLAGGDYPVSIALSYAAGLSMIFLPCTLPLVFVIVPLSMGRGYRKGFFMAVLFGFGIALTLTLYGIAVALLGDYFGLDKFTRGMFFVAGIVAYVFGLTQLGLLRIHLPELPLPSFIQKQKDYSKAFFMGVLLGNAGVGCPNPAFYVLLLYIATKASIASGGWLGFVHGLGRATPLLFLSILAILGVNATKWVAQKKDSIERLMGWGLIIVGVFIFTVGLFGMWWWESSFIHEEWNTFVEENVPRLAEAPSAAMAFNIRMEPSEIEKYWPDAPWFVMLAFLLVPVAWWRCRR